MEVNVAAIGLSPAFLPWPGVNATVVDIGMLMEPSRLWRP